MKKILAVLFSFSMIFISGCDSGYKQSNSSDSPFFSAGLLPAGIKISSFAAGFTAPVQITNAGDGSNRIFIVEKGGVIKIIKNGTVLPAPFFNISTMVSTGSEQGLLGIAFPADYTAKGYFYADYTNKTGIGNTVISRVLLTADPDVANSDDPRELLEIVQPFTNHNGGQLSFGPDGFLYIGMGDGGSAGDPLNNAQNKNSLLGKILRLDVESGVFPYSIPADNPFGNEIWSYGLRNPWKFSFDRTTGEIYIADVGQNKIEEVNVQPAASAGLNYGWPVMEGSSCFNNPACDPTGLILPVTEYAHSGGECSVTGGFVYRGSEFPELQGTYFYADFCSGKIRGLKKTGAVWESKVLLDTDYRISSFGEDEAGNIYFSDLTSGTIFKIEAL